MTAIPKAVLYHYPGSVWSAVGNILLYPSYRLFAHCVQLDWHCKDAGLRFFWQILNVYSEEKGYAPDEVDLRVVDLGLYCAHYFYSRITIFPAKGENYDPTFLRLNPAGKLR